MRGNQWARLLACVTGVINQDILLQNEYLAAENRILRAYLPQRLPLPPGSAVQGSGSIAAANFTCTLSHPIDLA
jgi:hypothetical protein